MTESESRYALQMQTRVGPWCVSVCCDGRLDGEAHQHSVDWAVPYSGFLAVDLVQIIKPPPTAQAATGEELAMGNEELQVQSAALTRVQVALALLCCFVSVWCGASA